MATLAVKVHVLVGRRSGASNTVEHSSTASGSDEVEWPIGETHWKHKRILGECSVLLECGRESETCDCEAQSTDNSVMHHACVRQAGLVEGEEGPERH
jgi:hypothetical protein